MKRSGKTPVYKLKTGTWEIEKVETKGDGPGWIWKHDAEFKENEIWVSSVNARKYMRTQQYVTKKESAEGGDGTGQDDIDMVDVAFGEAWILNLEDLMWRKVPHE